MDYGQWPMDFLGRVFSPISMLTLDVWTSNNNNMLRELKKNHCADPACQKRSDADHLRFVVHFRNDSEMKVEFMLELNGIKKWAVPGVPSMNPMDHHHVREEDETNENLLISSIQGEGDTQTWDKGNYIPIDDDGNALSEYEAIECLKQGVLKFFLQGSKLVGEFVLMKSETTSWLLMKRHDEFALYNELAFAEG